MALFADLIGTDHVAVGAAASAFAVDGCTPQCMLFPATIDDVSRCVAAAHAADLAVIPAGNGTQLGVGRVPRRYDVALSTRRLRRLVAHAAGDMTVTVEAGATVAELNTALASAGQRLPLDPPHPEQTTIGAMIATDACGPLRLSQGKVRDLLIGITAVLADGTTVKGGGRVVKNVAGYDLMKLFTGSFGTLGIVVEATFKVRPLPESEAAFVIPAADTQDAVTVALDALTAARAPLYVEALNRPAALTVRVETTSAAVVIGCGGAPQEIAAQHERLRDRFGAREVRPCDATATARLSAALRDFPATGVYGCTVSLLPSQLPRVLACLDDEAAERGWHAALVSHVGSGVASIRLHASGEGNGTFVPVAQRVRQIVRDAGGWVVFDILPVPLKEHIDPWDDDVPGLALMRGIKATLDPQGRLSPGRFVGGI